MSRPPLAFIAAIARDRVLGFENQLPWHHPEDLRFFRDMTLGHAIIQGRKTYDSVGKPLPNRRNLIVTRDREFTAAGCEVFHTPEEAVAAAREQDPCPFVLGGEQIYVALLPLATIVHLTFIDEVHRGDAFFPELPEQEWRLVRSRQGEQDPALTFCEYHRIAG